MPFFSMGRASGQQYFNPSFKVSGLSEPMILTPQHTTLSFPQHTGGEPQGEVLVRPWVKLDDAVPNVLGRPLAGLGIVVQDNKLHLVLQHGDNTLN